MVFSRAEYPIFLICVFFLFLILRRPGRVALIARLAVVLFLGDLTYLLLSRDLSSLWDPIGCAILRGLIAHHAAWRSPAIYLGGLAIYGGAIWLGHRAAGVLDEDRFQQRLAVTIAAILTLLGGAILAGSRLGVLDQMSAWFSRGGHAIFLALLGVSAGAAIIPSRTPSSTASGKRAGQLVLLFLVSCLFYHSWAASMPGAYKYLLLLILGTITLDYYLALWIEAAEDPVHRKLLVVVSLVSNLGVLALFKYFDFFISIGNGVAATLGAKTMIEPFALILPAGISFHTFQSLSYTIDVYQRKLQPTRSILHFATFVLFFPQLVAGPIVRAHEFMPQLERDPRLDPPFDDTAAGEGIFRILVGLTKKIAFADVLGVTLVDRVFAEPRLFSSVEVAAAVVGYALQIYFDFSAYSDIAIGSARLLGFHFPENFDTPYRSATLQEFWRRWHMTLSSWLRDYLYIALGGSRGPQWKTYRNLILTMLLGGLWHGASWSFIAWGGLHGAGLAATRVLQRRIEGLGDPIARASRSAKAAALLVAAALVCGLAHRHNLRWIEERSEKWGMASTWPNLLLLWIYATPAWAGLSVWLDDKSTNRSAGEGAEEDLDDLLPPTNFNWRSVRRGLEVTFVVSSAALLAVLRYGRPSDWAPAIGVWFAVAGLLELSLGEYSGAAIVEGARRLGYRAGGVMLTFGYVAGAWIFFRAATFEGARMVYAQLGTGTVDAGNLGGAVGLALGLGAVLHFFPKGVMGWVRDAFVRLPAPVRGAVVVGVGMGLRGLARPTVVPFIYFQF